MKVTIIIPLYNAKKTIESTIESVFKQTYSEPLEIIVINDGSTDGCENIVSTLIMNNKTNRIIKLINKENTGVSNTRNRGIKEARGEYIAFLDSDDVWHPKKIEIVMYIMKEKKIDFLGHSYTLENNFNETSEKKYLIQITFFQLLLKNFAVTPSIVIKKDIFDCFNENMSHTEDHELWLRMALKYKVFYIDLDLVKLGRPALSKGGLSSNKWAMRKGEIQMYKNIVMIKKSLIPFIPFFIIFSLGKHFKNYLKDLFEKN